MIPFPCGSFQSFPELSGVAWYRSILKKNKVVEDDYSLLWHYTVNPARKTEWSIFSFSWHFWGQAKRKSYWCSLFSSKAVLFEVIFWSPFMSCIAFPNGETRYLHTIVKPLLYLGKQEKAGDGQLSHRAGLSCWRPYCEVPSALTTPEMMVKWPESVNLPFWLCQAHSQKAALEGD